MTTGAHPLPHRVRLPHRRPVWFLVALAAAAGIAVGLDRAFLSGGGQASRPELQRLLDGLVSRGVAPGVTAYVVGPHGTWEGSAGLANLAQRTAMPADARMRIESNSKTWLVAVILQLQQEGKLTVDETVAHWLPGLLRSYGFGITIRELLTDTSGLIDDNDVFHATPSGLAAMIARVGDAGLRADLLATAARVRKNPRTPVPALLFVRLAAWQPLVAAPGTTYHHSNIGWNIAGLIAQKAGGKPLAELYRERLFEPLGLRHTAFSPQGPIAGEHANGYAPDAKGRLVDTTAMHPGKFADGAIVTDARDEATFLRGAMDGTLFAKSLWLDLYGRAGGRTGCGPAYSGEGAGDGYHSFVWFDATGRHVEVLLLNRNEAAPGAAAARALYCGA